MKSTKSNDRKPFITFVSLFLSGRTRHSKSFKLVNEENRSAYRFFIEERDSSTFISSPDSGLSFYLMKDGGSYSLVDPSKRDYILFTQMDKYCSVFDYSSSSLYEVASVASNKLRLINTFDEHQEDYKFQIA